MIIFNNVNEKNEYFKKYIKEIFTHARAIFHTM